MLLPCCAFFITPLAIKWAPAHGPYRATEERESARNPNEIYLFLIYLVYSLLLHFPAVSAFIVIKFPPSSRTKTASAIGTSVFFAPPDRRFRPPRHPGVCVCVYVFIYIFVCFGCCIAATAATTECCTAVQSFARERYTRRRRDGPWGLQLDSAVDAVSAPSKPVRLLSRRLEMSSLPAR